MENRKEIISKTEYQPQYMHYIVAVDIKPGFFYSYKTKQTTKAVTINVDPNTIRGHAATAVFLVGIKEWEFAEHNPKAYDALQKAMITTEGQFVEV